MKTYNKRDFQRGDLPIFNGPEIKKRKCLTKISEHKEIIRKIMQDIKEIEEVINTL